MTTPYRNFNANGSVQPIPNHPMQSSLYHPQTIASALPNTQQQQTHHYQQSYPSSHQSSLSSSAYPSPLPAYPSPPAPAAAPSAPSGYSQVQPPAKLNPLLAQSPSSGYPFLPTSTNQPQQQQQQQQQFASATRPPFANPSLASSTSLPANSSASSSFQPPKPLSYAAPALAVNSSTNPSLPPVPTQRQSGSFYPANPINNNVATTSTYGSSSFPLPPPPPPPSQSTYPLPPLPHQTAQIIPPPSMPKYPAPPTQFHDDGPALPYNKHQSAPLPSPQQYAAPNQFSTASTGILPPPPQSMHASPHSFPSAPQHLSNYSSSPSAGYPPPPPPPPGQMMNSAMPHSPALLPSSSMEQQHQQQQQYNATPIVPPWVQPVHPKHLTLTCSAFPNSGALRLRSQIPFGGVLRPLADIPGDVSIPVINPSGYGVIRCKDCRAYVNPYATWHDGGQRWRCNFCGISNDIPPQYYSPLDQYGRRKDLMERPELYCSSVEIVAPVDYMVRPPMPPVYFFLLDVSLPSIQSGVLISICSTIASALDHLPGHNEKRTLIGFLSFDSTLHFYTLKPGTGVASMWVVADVKDIFLPAPTDLLVNLDESRAEVDSLLSSLPSLHNKNRDVESAFGPALEAALQVVSRIGARLVCFLSSLPSFGEGRLTNRENSRLYGSDKEHILLSPPNDLDYYKKKAVQFTKYQVCCDCFALGDSFMDLATLSELSRTTGGSLYYYPGYNQARLDHREKMKKELYRCLTRTQGWEAVVRIRASKGVTLTDYHGNFYLRGSDLLALPAIDSDKTITFELRNDDTSSTNSNTTNTSILTDRSIVVQTALLYTTSEGERRIRVQTAALGLAGNLTELYDRVNTNAIVNVMTKHAIRIVYTEGFDRARESIRNRAVALLRTYRGSIPKLNPNSQQSINQELALLPLMTLGALKNLILKEGVDVRTDVRAFVLTLAYSMGIVELETFLRPRMLPVHDLNGDVGLMNADGEVNLPAEASLTSDVLQPDQIYLLDNGVECLLRVGKSVKSQILLEYFGLHSLQGVDGSKLGVRELPADAANSTTLLARFMNILNYLRALSPHYQCLFVVKEGEASEIRFLNLLIEDRQGSAMGLAEFEHFIYQRGGQPNIY